MSAQSDMRIVFAGTPEFAAHHLERLIKHTHHEIVGVYTQPDRPAGRGKKILGSAVKDVAQTHDLPIYQPVSLKDADAQAELKELAPDLMIVVAYGLILPQAVLDLPTYGCINVHASLLPRWRGAAPIQRAIEMGDDMTGITIMQMDEGLDTGDMLAMAEIPISNLDTSKSLHNKLFALGAPLLQETIGQIGSGTLKPTEQDDTLSTYAQKITKQEAALNWSDDAETIDRKVRAFNPFPIAYSEILGERVRIHEAYPLPAKTSSAQPGTIVHAGNDGIDVATGSNLLRITQLQLPGKKALPASDVMRGNANLFAVGQQFTSPQSNPVG